MLEDAQLLRRYVEEKSEAVFTELVRRNISLVYSAALRLMNGDTHRAQDVTQIVFTTLARRAESLTHHPVLTGWLYTTTHHAAAKARRTESRRQAREQEAHVMQEIFSSPEPAIEWDQIRPALDAIMCKLGERDREAVLLRYFEQRPFAEIGAALGLSEDAARMRVERALEKLRALLAGRGVTSTSAALGLVLTHQAAVAAPLGLAATVSGKALAGASATTSALGFLQFMSSTKFALGAAALVCLLAIGTATREAWARRAAETSLAAASHDYDALVVQSRDLENRARIAEQDAVQLKRRIDEVTAAQLATQKQATATSSAAPNAPASDPVAEGKAFLARHPEVHQALIDGLNAQMQFIYGPLYRSLGFTAAQIEEFQAVMRANAVTIAQVGPDGLMVPLLIGSAMPQTEVQPRLRELLGEEGMRKLAEVSRTKSARDLTAQMAGALCFTETPLTPQQSAQMIQILAGNQSKEREAQSNGFDWNAVTTKAQGVLSAPQLVALERMRAQAAVSKPPTAAATNGSSPK